MVFHLVAMPSDAPSVRRLVAFTVAGVVALVRALVGIMALLSAVFALTLGLTLCETCFTAAVVGRGWPIGCLVIFLSVVQ